MLHILFPIKIHKTSFLIKGSEKSYSKEIEYLINCSVLAIWWSYLLSMGSPF